MNESDMVNWPTRKFYVWIVIFMIQAISCWPFYLLGIVWSMVHMSFSKGAIAHREHYKAYESIPYN